MHRVRNSRSLGFLEGGSITLGYLELWANYVQPLLHEAPGKESLGYVSAIVLDP